MNPENHPAPDGATALPGAPIARWAVLRVRNFRLLWLGQLVSMLGDQVHLIAMPWLVLQLTGSPLALGTVLALGGIPRALLMLIGGALTDRFSPRAILLASALLRLALTALLAALVWGVAIELWNLYAIALVFGVVDAFSFPAGAAMMPEILAPEQLQAGNALNQGSFQLTQLVGPALAGLLIALLGGSATGPDGEMAPGLAGIAAAFAFDSLTFLISAATLWRIRMPERPRIAPGEQQNVWAAIRAGIVYVWRDPTLRGIFTVVAAINFLFAGPLVVGAPVLADTRFAEGAAGYGMVIAALGGGSLAGTLLAGLLPPPSPRRLGPLLLGLAALLGVGLATIGFLWSTWAAAAVTLLMGAANGYVGILYLTWLQKAAPAAMMGRVMSLQMFASVGLVPVSMALAGALIQVSITGFLASAGLLLAATLLAALANPAIRDMGLRPAAGVEAMPAP
ncbi:MAG TPA: MFS transporter [Caldilineaceae bacterium]|nr:MFS transporter [Caldilineaceae bacterium]